MKEPVINRNSEVAALTDGTQREEEDVVCARPPVARVASNEPRRTFIDGRVTFIEIGRNLLVPEGARGPRPSRIVFGHCAVSLSRWLPYPPSLPTFRDVIPQDLGLWEFFFCFSTAATALVVSITETRGRSLFLPRHPIVVRVLCK